MAGASVVLVDDHRMTAFALRDSLVSRGVSVLAVEHTASAAMAAIKSSGCEVLVTDLDLGEGPSGLDLAIQARKLRPRLGVVILTAYEDPKLYEPSVPALPRVYVYVVKQQLGQADDLVRAVVLARDYATGTQRPATRPSFPLSVSQAQILRLVAMGLSNQAIAQELSMTLDSVNTTVKRLARKFGIRRESDTNSRVLLTQQYFQLIGFVRDR